MIVVSLLAWKQVNARIRYPARLGDPPEGASRTLSSCNRTESPKWLLKSRVVCHMIRLSDQDLQITHGWTLEGSPIGVYARHLCHGRERWGRFRHSAASQEFNFRRSHIPWPMCFSREVPSMSTRLHCDRRRSRSLGGWRAVCRPSDQAGGFPSEVLLDQ